jgi:hypothetical protein
MSYMRKIFIMGSVDQRIQGIQSWNPTFVPYQAHE